MALDGAGKVCVTGTSGGSTGVADFLTIKYVQTGGIEEKNDPRCSMHDAGLKIHPNPFRGRTMITFAGADQAISGSVGSGPGHQQSGLRIYDATGRLVKSFGCNSSLVAHGSLLASWDGSDDQGAALPAGVYFVQLKPGGLSQTARVVLID